MKSDSSFERYKARLVSDGRSQQGGVFVRDPLSYEYEIFSEIPDVDIVSLGLDGFINQLKTECTGSVKSIFYFDPGLEGGVFVRDPLSYEYEIFSEIPDVDIVSLGLDGFINQLKTECTGSVKSIFYLDPGLDSEFDLNKQNNNGGSELYDDDYNVYDYSSPSESDTASINHLSEGEEEVLEVRTKKVGPKPKKKSTRMFGEKFLKVPI
nr:hypothetical protein [Tanacetum cinerariifolium]